MAITSLAFMLELVPEPVWKTSTGKCVVVLARGDLVGGRGDRVRHRPVEHADVLVDARRGRLDQPQRADLRALQPAPGDREVLDGPLGLRPPQRVGGHLDLAHRVVLDPEAALLAHGAQSSPDAGRAPGGVAQRTACTTSPRASEPKKRIAAALERWMQPCEVTARLPWWNAMPGMKNTE